MSLTRFQSTESTPVRSTFVNANGDGITGLSPTIRIQRDNGDYLDNNDNSWQAAPVVVDHPMTEVDAARKPGEYNFTFDPSGTTGVNDEDKYIFRTDGTAAAANRIQTMGALFGGFPGSAENVWGFNIGGITAGQLQGQLRPNRRDVFTVTRRGRR